MDNTLKITNTVTTSISITGAVLVLLHYSLARIPQTLVSRLLAFMSLADLVTSTFKSIGIEKAGENGSLSGLCQTQAFFIQWGNFSHILWNGMLSIYLFLLFNRRWTMAQLTRIQRYDWVPCIIAPLIVALGPIFSLAANNPIYTKTKIWCWIGPANSGVQLAIHFVPLWLIFLYSLFNYVMIAKRIWTYRYSDFDKMTAYSKYSFSRAATLCILLFIITWIPSTANRVYTMIHLEESNVLNLLQNLFSGLRGMNYALLYLFFQLSTYIRKRTNPDGVSMADNGFLPNKQTNGVELGINKNSSDLSLVVTNVFNSRADTPSPTEDHPSLGRSISSLNPMIPTRAKS